MPLIKVTPIDEILQTAGVKPKDSESLDSKLKSNRLDTDSLFSHLGEIVSSSENDITRLQALKMALQLNSETRQAMTDDKAKTAPIVNIIINDSQSVSINPILIPRER